MDETAQVAQEEQETQTKKPVKPTSIKILQWVELLFGVIIFLICLYLDGFLEFKPDEIFFYLIFLPVVPFLLFSTSFLTQNIKLIKSSIAVAYLLLVISMGAAAYSFYIIARSFGTSTTDIGGLVIALIVALFLIILIGSIVILPMVVVTLIFLRRNLKILREASP